MTRQNHISPKSKVRNPQSLPRNPSPNEILNTSDPGDETQRRYRYQHAYGVILLVAAICNKNPYIAIWCEHHEDLLGERKDGLYDAYQVKTQQPSYGLWELTKEPLKASIKRFVELDLRFPGKIKELVFVSNVGYEDSRAKNKFGRSPKYFLQAIQQVASQDELEVPFNEAFEILRTYCDCTPSNLMATLKKLKLVQGPDLDSFEAVIAQEHLPQIRECSTLPAMALATLRDELIAQINRASSLSVGNPSRHWRGLHEGDHFNPKLVAKRISIESFIEYININWQRFQSILENASILNKRLEEVLFLYLGKSFDEEQFAKLDQAGETDPDRSTLLRQVFVDLELKPRNELSPIAIKKFQLTSLQEEEVEIAPSERKALSAMKCFLKEPWPLIVIIGGPGQGKSTVGQYLAQVHRGFLLNRENEFYQDIAGSKAPRKKFKPETLRIPFRIVLKYFAQWIADGPTLESVEAYIAEQVNKGASRPDGVSASDIQQIMKSRSILIIFDGLDEVTEPELRDRVLNRVEEFLGRAKLLKVDLQVIATSRPTGYSDQFDPKQFWHLELQPMSVTKVREYTYNWAIAKVTIEEERRRVKDTLEECLQEEHTRLLLTTPLQVTIVLLIIKDGGRPPAQREALFQNYWTTILRREKSKAKGVIRTDETLLFNLHAYLGYLLHRKSGDGNVRSLLSTEDFEEKVYHFLEENDKYSPQVTLRQLVAQMLKEARDRLVLLVEPEPGLFGFELRSLQEFFAAAYLVQTASGTPQRFGRLRAIARSEHWRNVALFFAGRIVRDFGGEAVNILEQGCRPIDREQSDTRIRRGSWLALDIAADGIFASNRNLQYSALEHALTVLSTGISSNNRRHLASTLQKLSPDDYRDILSRLLKQKQVSLPLSCLPAILRLYDKSKGDRHDFMEGLDVLLSSNQPVYILKALELAFSYQVEPEWLVKQLKKFWNNQDEQEIIRILLQGWHINYQYAQKVFSALDFDKDQIYHLLDKFSPNRIYEYTIKRNLKVPEKITEQINILLVCNNIITTLILNSDHMKQLPGSTNEIEFSVFDMSKYELQLKQIISSKLLETLDRLIKDLSLLPQLRLCIWNLYFRVHRPDESMVAAFIKECGILAEKFPETFQEDIYINPWPLITHAYKLQFKGDKNAVKHLMPYLNASQELSIRYQVESSVQALLQTLTVEEKISFALNVYGRNVSSLPELAPLAEQLEISIGELVEMYVYSYISENYKYSSKLIQLIFSIIKNNLDRPEIIQSLTQEIHYPKLPKEREIFDQGAQLITLLLEQLSQRPDILESIVNIFLRLIALDRKAVELAPSLLPAMLNFKEESDIEFHKLIYLKIIEDIPQSHLVELAKFVKSEDESVKLGALTLWERLIGSLLSRRYAIEGKEPIMVRFRGLELDWQVSLPLIRDTDIGIRRRGITLLTFSEFPIMEAMYREQLLNAIAKAQDIREIRAWADFLQNILIPESKASDWKVLLETILDRPQTYTNEILDAAMERYTSLIDKVGPEIMGDETALGLSIVTEKGHL